MIEDIATVKEVAKILKISVNTVRDMIKLNKIKGFKIGNRLRVITNSLPNYKEQDNDKGQSIHIQ